MSDLTSWLHEFADACEIVAAGRWPGPRTAARLREVADALAAAQQEQAVSECHCATCTCAPGMTPAVRFDTSPAAQEGAVRDHLIALGWTPPGAHQTAAGVVDDTRRIRALADNYWRLEPFDMPTPGGDDADVGWRVIEFHRAEPRERVVVEHYRDNPREAIDAALAAQRQEPKS